MQHLCMNGVITSYSIHYTKLYDIYSEGKTVEQIKAIVQKLMVKNNNIIASRANKVVYEGIKEVTEDAVYYEMARMVVIKKREIPLSSKYIAIVTAGTSDMPVAEEAAITAETLGNRVERVYDVGVAGIHRLFERLDILMNRNNFV